MSHAYAKALEEVKSVEDKLRKDLTSLEEKVSQEAVGEFKEKIEIINLGFQRDIKDAALKPESEENGSSHVLSSVNDLTTISFTQNEEADLKIKSILKALEPVYRKIQLFRPKSEKDFIDSLRWFSQQRSIKILDLFEQTTAEPPYHSEEIKFLLEQGQTIIFKRECNELLEFYNLEPEELKAIVKSTIKFGKNLEHPAMREIFGTEKPSEVINALRQIKLFLEKHQTPVNIRIWFETPIRDFKNSTPREALFQGRVFPVLEFLHIIEERVYN